MDTRIETAFEVANYMATLSNQRRIILEEFDQQLVYYTNGATFKIGPELISIIKTMLDLGHTTDIAIVDTNNLPVIISDLQSFFVAVNDYAAKFSDISSKRKLKDMVEL
jgi:hypothetical protein